MIVGDILLRARMMSIFPRNLSTVRHQLVLPLIEQACSYETQ